MKRFLLLANLICVLFVVTSCNNNPNVTTPSPPKATVVETTQPSPESGTTEITAITPPPPETPPDNTKPDQTNPNTAPTDTPVVTKPVEIQPPNNTPPDTGIVKPDDIQPPPDTTVKPQPPPDTPTNPPIPPTSAEPQPPRNPPTNPQVTKPDEPQPPPDPPSTNPQVTEPPPSGTLTDYDFTQNFTMNGRGRVEITLLGPSPKGGFRAEVNAIPAANSYFFHFGAVVGDSSSEYRSLSQNPTMFNLNQDGQYTVYFRDQPVFVTLTGTPFLKFYQSSATHDQTNRAAYDTVRAINNRLINDLLERSITKIYPSQFITLGDGSHDNSMGSTNSAGYIGTQPVMDMSNGFNAGVLAHEIGHNIQTNLVITDAQLAEIDRLYWQYRQQFVDRGEDIAYHYQIGYGSGEFFACTVAAYFDMLGGSGTIGRRADFERDYRDIFLVLQQIFA